MAVHYYDEDDIEVGNPHFLPSLCKPHSGTDGGGKGGSEKKSRRAVHASRTPQDAGTAQEADCQTRKPSPTQLIQFLIMKPRNIFEKAVLAQSEKLRPITKGQEEMGFPQLHRPLCLSPAERSHHLYGLRTYLGNGAGAKTLFLPQLQSGIESPQYQRAQGTAETLFHSPHHKRRVSSASYVPAHSHNGKRLQGKILCA